MYRNVDRVGVQTERLPLVGVMVSERGLHVLQSRRIVDRGFAVGSVPENAIELKPRDHEVRKRTAKGPSNVVR